MISNNYSNNHNLEAHVASDKRYHNAARRNFLAAGFILEIGLLTSTFCDTTYCVTIQGCPQYTPFTPPGYPITDNSREQQEQQKAIYDIIAAENPDIDYLDLPNVFDYDDVCVNLTFQKVLNVLGLLFGVFSVVLVFMFLITGGQNVSTYSRVFKIIGYFTVSLFALCQLIQFCDMASLNNNNRLFKELKSTVGPSFALSIASWFLATSALVLIFLGFTSVQRAYSADNDVVVVIPSSKPDLRA
ncbi:hypothetical protein HDU76_003888 [Blyttiomyces sp. JEL0837]|nr:hypothetical protein HDU76_003888 [Blyttiomyces sp. JEL0837]